MITPDDIRRCAALRWRQTPGTPAAVPGGLWFARVPPEAPAPYAQMRVALRETHPYAGGRYTRAFELRVSAWADVDPGRAVDAGTVERVLSAAFDFPASSRLAVAGGRVVVCRPLDADEDLDESLRAGLDVCVTRAAWRLVVEGTG